MRGPRGRTDIETPLWVLKLPSPSNVSRLVPRSNGVCSGHFLAGSLLPCRTRSRIHKPPTLRWLSVASPSADPTSGLAEPLCATNPCHLIVSGLVFLTEPQEFSLRENLELTFKAGSCGVPMGQHQYITSSGSQKHSLFHEGVHKAMPSMPTQHELTYLLNLAFCVRKSPALGNLDSQR